MARAQLKTLGTKGPGFKSRQPGYNGAAPFRVGERTRDDVSLFLLSEFNAGLDVPAPTAP